MSDVCEKSASPCNHWVKTCSKNCKNWLKYIYELPVTVDENFWEFGNQFGKIKVLDFSKFSKSSKVFFKIVNKEMLIEGALRDNKLFYSCPKTVKGAKKIINEFETKLTEWLCKK